MAVEFSVGKRTTEYRFATTEIELRPEMCGRHVKTDLESLIASIAQDGQQVPVIIRRDGSKPVLVDGYRRYEAICEINRRKLTPLPVQVRACYSQADDVEAMWIAIKANRERADTLPMDDAANIKMLKKLGQTDEQIAEGYFPGCLEDKDKRRKALAWIAKRESLLGLTKEAQAALTGGEMKLTAAEHLSKLQAEQQREAMKKAKGGRVTTRDIATASGKKAKLTSAQAKQRLDNLISDGCIGDFKILKPIMDWLIDLRDAM